MKKLLWDSEYWGIDIFNLGVNEKFTTEFITDKTLVQSLVNVSNLQYISYLEKNDFHFKENKITLIKSTFKNYPSIYLDKTKYSTLTLKDISSNKKELLGLFNNNSRYDLFDEKKIKEFYYLWVENTILGKMDDYCIGYFEENKLKGFVTYKLKEDVLVIGLLGVLPKFQGQGISKYLLNYIDSIAKEINMPIKIATQGTNIHAINAYINSGYKILSIDSWYYYTKGLDL